MDCFEYISRNGKTFYPGFYNYNVYVDVNKLMERPINIWSKKYKDVEECNTKVFDNETYSQEFLRSLIVK